jgi:hypothetical protein
VVCVGVANDWYPYPVVDVDLHVTWQGGEHEFVLGLGR